jgi:hypothetical protein
MYLGQMVDTFVAAIFIISAIVVSVFKNVTLGQLDHVHTPAEVMQHTADRG